MYVANDLTIGGAEEIYLLFSKYLDKNKFDILFIVIGEKGEIGKEIEKHAPTIFLNIPGRPLTFKNKIKAISQIYKICKKFSPHIIHSQLWTSDVLARIAGIIRGIPNIITEQNVYPNRDMIRLLVDKLLSYHTKKIIAVSKPVKEFIIKNQKISKKKIKIIYNSFDQLKFRIKKDKHLRKKMSIKDKIPVIICVGMLGRTKNQKVIIEALSYINEKFILLLLGDGPEKNKLKKLAKSLGISKNVKFLGWRRDVADILNISDIFVLSSCTEGFSLSLMEAMYMKKVCVVSNIKQNKILIKKENGFIFPPDNSEELSKILLFLIKNKGIWRKFGDQARKTVKTQFSMKKMIKNYEMLYKKYAC